MILPLVEALRPKQWTKNLLVFVGIVFAQHATDPALIVRAVAGFFGRLWDAIVMFFKSL